MDRVSYNRGSGWRGKKRPEHSALLKSRGFVPADYFTDTTKTRMSASIALAVKEGRVHTDNFRGHHHTEETKEKMRLAMTGRKVSQATKDKILDTKMRVYGKLNFNNGNTYSHAKRGWYKIGRKKVYFRSAWEANYALYLDFLVKNQQIKKWEFEKKTFWFENIRRGIRSYCPDFRITKLNGLIEYHEVKGYMDDKSKTKIKRMAKYYPEIKLIVIDKDCYNDIKNKIGKMLKFY